VPKWLKSELAVGNEGESQQTSERPNFWLSNTAALLQLQLVSPVKKTIAMPLTLPTTTYQAHTQVKAMRIAHSLLLKVVK
jgi:hypothetical protein